MLTTIVMEQLRTAPFIKKEILEAVVVIITPDRAHRDTRAQLVKIGYSEFNGYVLERAIALISIQGVPAAFAAVGQIDVLPTIAIKINDRCTSPHRRNLRHDVIQFVIQCRRLMNEAYTRGLGDFLKIEAVAGQRLAGI